MNPMVYISRRATAKPGKIQDAVKWALEVADYINNKFETNLGVYTQRYGDNAVGTLYWVGKLESMAKYEELTNKLNEDEGYLTRIQEFVKLFVEGTTFDSLLDKH